MSLSSVSIFVSIFVSTRFLFCWKLYENYRICNSKMEKYRPFPPLTMGKTTKKWLDKPLFVVLVELRGFEPLTSTLPVWHSSQLS